MSFDPDTFEKLTGRREPVVDVAGSDPRFAAQASSDKQRAILIARVLLKAPNIDRDSDVACLAIQFLRALGLPERE